MEVVGYYKQFDVDQVSSIIEKYRIQPMVSKSIERPSEFERGITKIFGKCLKKDLVPLFSTFLTQNKLAKFYRLMSNFSPRWSITMRKQNFTQSCAFTPVSMQGRVLDFQRLIKSCGSFSFSDNQVMVFLQQIFCHFLETFSSTRNMLGDLEKTDLMNHYKRQIFEMELVGRVNSLHEAKLFSNIFCKKDSKDNINASSERQQTLVRDRLLVDNNGIESIVNRRAQKGYQIIFAPSELQVYPADIFPDLSQFERKRAEGLVQQRQHEWWEKNLIEEKGVYLFKRDNRKRNIIVPYVPDVELQEQDDRAVLINGYFRAQVQGQDNGQRDEDEKEECYSGQSDQSQNSMGENDLDSSIESLGG